MSEPKEEAAVVKLGLKEFIGDHFAQIRERLEYFDSVVMARAGSETDTLFLAESLPFVNSVIQVGSPNGKYIKAIEWMRSEMPEAAPVSILTGLVFLYIVEKGAEWAKKDGGKGEKKTWERIEGRARRLKGEPMTPARPASRE